METNVEARAANRKTVEMSFLITFGVLYAALDAWIPKTGCTRWR
jgi:hypothetical protein